MSLLTLQIWGVLCLCVRVVLVELLRSPLLSGGLEPHRLGTGPL